MKLRQRLGRVEKSLSSLRAVVSILTGGLNPQDVQKKLFRYRAVYLTGGLGTPGSSVQEFDATNDQEAIVTATGELMTRINNLYCSGLRYGTALFSLCRITPIDIPKDQFPKDAG